MKRRRFVQSATTISLMAASDSLLAQDVYTPDKQLSAPEPTDYIVSGICASGSYLHILQRSRTNRVAHKVTVLSADGKVAGTWVDTGCFAPQIATASDGNTVLLFAHLAAMKVVSCVVLSPSGSVVNLRDTQLPAIPISFAVVGANIVAYHRSGETTISSLSGEVAVRTLNSVLPAVPMSGYTPQFSLVSVQATGVDTALLLDLASARLALMDVTSAKYASGQVRHPSVDRALDNAKQFVPGVEGRATNVKAPTPLAFSAAAGDGLGNVICTPAPISPRAPLFLKLDKNGTVDKQFRCSFSDRSNKADKVMFYLALRSDQLTLAFRDGDLISYHI